MKTLIAILMLGVATPALAQHSGHTMPMPMPAPKPKPAPAPAKKPAPAPVKKTAAPVRKAPAPVKQAGPAEPKAAAKVQSTPDTAMDHDMMDHGAMDDAKPMTDSMDPAMPMDHPAMHHSAMAMPMPIPDVPPPPAAGTGPARAADAIWGAEAMRGARDQLRDQQGGQNFLWFMADRAEYRLRDGKDGYLWDVQGYYGGDINKFWFKSEGEGSFGQKIESAEVQALYSRAIGPWFDLQAGVRQDFAPRDRTYAVVGVQGLAPYVFEVDAAAFLSDKGDLTARFEGELDQRITQRLILQPRAEVNLAAQDIPELGIGAGIDTLELGLRLRYEFTREFAPYIGVAQEWKVGQSADYARADGEASSATNYVVGVRLWF